MARNLTSEGDRRYRPPHREDHRADRRCVPAGPGVERTRPSLDADREAAPGTAFPHRTHRPESPTTADSPAITTAASLTLTAIDVETANRVRGKYRRGGCDRRPRQCHGADTFVALSTSRDSQSPPTQRRSAAAEIGSPAATKRSHTSAGVPGGFRHPAAVALTA